MGMKDKVVLAVGLAVIFAIAYLITYGSNEISGYEMKASEAQAAALLQQKDVLIAKLVNQIKVKQAQLDSLKADLNRASSKLDASKTEVEGVKKKLDNIRAELNTPIETPAQKK
jgi:capsule polysaccharide export protein KpsE/RkpR